MTLFISSCVEDRAARRYFRPQRAHVISSIPTIPLLLAGAVEVGPSLAGVDAEAGTFSRSPRWNERPNARQCFSCRIQVSKSPTAQFCVSADSPPAHQNSLGM